MLEPNDKLISRYSDGHKIKCSKATSNFIDAIYSADTAGKKHLVDPAGFFFIPNNWNDRKKIPKDKWVFIKLLPYISTEKMITELNLQFIRNKDELSDSAWRRHVRSMQRYAKNGYNLDTEDMTNVYYKYLKWLM